MKEPIFNHLHSLDSRQVPIYPQALIVISYSLHMKQFNIVIFERKSIRELDLSNRKSNFYVYFNHFSAKKNTYKFTYIKKLNAEGSGPKTGTSSLTNFYAFETTALVKNAAKNYQEML